MKRHKFIISVRLILVATLALAFGISQSFAQSEPKKDKELKLRSGKLTTAEREAAAKRAADLGLKPGVAGLATPLAAATPLPPTDAGTVQGPGGVPHYFGPYANWAFSPLPKGQLNAEVTVDSGGNFYTNPTVTIVDAYDNTVTDPATATVVNGEITAISVTSTNFYSAPVVVIEDLTGADAAATATLNTATLQGGIRKFIDKMPGLGPANANALGQYIPVAVPETREFSGQQADYYEIALVEYEEQLHSNLPKTRLRGYVQLSTTVSGVPLFQVDGVTPINKPDGTQAIGVDTPHYLGPIIVSQGRVLGIPNANPGDPGYPKPVRIKFYNLLPTGTGGDLFIPVDGSIAGAGYGASSTDKFTQNRATIHLHGNNTVWISDGNVHQWISPATENTPYPKGVSVRNVPDMPDALNPNAVDCDAPNSGCMTFFYTNAQSARLQFYHDHALGITRLNVYAGEAAGYVIQDAVEKDMIDGTNITGVNPDHLKVLPDIGIPLIIQDRTFVDAETIFAQDPTWNWGTGPRDPATGNLTGAVTGDLWYPHVYMTVQNPYDLTGTNAFGRWHYGPWFNPPTPQCDANGEPVGCISVGTVANPYYQPVCDLDPESAECTAPWEPPLMPGVPNPSMPGESFLDTQLVNGTAYPYLELEPKAYRFRVLNASNDRFVNLQLYVAADKNTVTTPDGYVPGATRPNLCTGGVLVENCTEVNMVPVYVAPENQYADTPSGIPDPAAKGPAWIQIGTEGGFMPKPIVVPQQPVGYNLDPAYFNFGVVNQHSLFLGAAERADVVVDFSQYAGKTLILYNDSPAPVPAGAAPYDFYTGNGNQMDGGGAPNTQPGYGPNTRTIMQIRVANTTPADPYSLTTLASVFAKTNTKRGVFEVSQDPIIIPQAAYNSAYNNKFPSNAVGQYFNINDTEKTFKPINEKGELQQPVTLPLEMKAMHDEMGGVYDVLFGRMSGMLGVSLLNSPNHVLVPFGLASPPTDLVKGSLETTPIGVMPDGTQIWRIFHNGVDTHPVHTHLFHAQLINRLGQDGQWYSPSRVDPSDLGWKDTFKVNPLEITYLAMRPTVPTPSQVPFEVPNSFRLIDPTLPEGEPLMPPPPAGWFDPQGINIPMILNHYVNFGWEYVWHCHILSHEEMDMMHSLVFVVPPTAPTNLSATVDTTKPNKPTVNLTWNDNSLSEERYDIQRATDAAFTTGLTTFTLTLPLPNTVAGTVQYADKTVAKDTTYWYRVFAIGPTVGDTQSYANSNGFPTMSANSVSNPFEILAGAVKGQPIAPTGLTATLQAGPQIALAWTDNATNETGYVIERSVDGAAFSTLASLGVNANSYSDSIPPPLGSTYAYRVAAMNGTIMSAYSNTASATLPPAAPTVLTANLEAGPQIALAWTDNATTETGYVIERSVNGSVFFLLTSLPADSISFVDVGPLSPGDYTYRVAATSGTIMSAYSNTASVTVPLIPPTGLTATLLPGSQISLNWTDIATNETGYVIERSVGVGAFSILTTTAANTISFVDIGPLSPGTYNYRVAAASGAIMSAYSNTASATVQAPPPNAPTNLTAALQAGSQIALSWTDNATDETGYVIERSVGVGAFSILTTTAANATSFVDIGPLSPGAYNYRVAAANGTIMSAYSNTAGSTVLPAAPTGLAATLQTGPQIALSWADNANNETGYVIERSVGVGAFSVLTTTAANAITFVDIGPLTPGSTYNYRVAAASGAIMSAYSNTASAIVPAPVPAAPTNLTATLQAGPQIALSWTDNATDETGYVIERSVGVGAFSILTTTAANATSFVDIGPLSPGTYNYRVAAANGTVMSAYSNTASATVPGPPAAPVIITATAAPRGNKNERVTLTWSDVTGETGYTIQWSSDNFATVSGSGSVGAGVTTFTTNNILRQVWLFKVGATNAAGTTWSGPLSVPAAQ